jgi:hypothetical protein
MYAPGRGEAANGRDYPILLTRTYLKIARRSRSAINVG